MKKSLLAIALAVATMPFTTFAKAAPQAGITPAATTATKTKKHVKKVKKTKHAAATTPVQK